MGKSLHIGTYAGIPVFVHWTFGLLVLGLGYYSVHLGFDLQATLWFAAYVFTLFFCVVLHEYGHALMARKFGVETRDIILSPIGGLARLESIPAIPKQELWIAIAGPLVNVFIALLIAIGMSVAGMILIPEMLQFPRDFTEYVQLVLALNVVLFIFNLIPAFPMDGGRILRATLALKFEYHKATLYASIIGRIFAVVFVIAGFYSTSPTWVLIGIFIFYMATQENRHVKRSATLKSTTVKEISNYNYTVLYEHEPIAKAIDQNKLTDERSFLIKHTNGRITGTLPEVIIEYAFKNNLISHSIASVMSTKLQRVHEGISIFEAFNLLDKNDLGMLLVTDTEENIVAVLDRSRVKSFLKGI